MLIVENIWWVLVLIGIMIMIHELGHYWAARFFDVRVEAFSFGFGPRLFGFRKGETDFRVSAILFGGYVKMAGEQAGDDMASDPRSFLSKPRWQRLIIAFAGPFMNIILVVAILTGLFMVKYPKMPELGQPGVLGMVLPDSAAAKAGLREGDRIIGVNGKMNPSWEDILLEEIASANQPMRIVYLRNGETLETSVTPELDERNGIGTAGWAEQAEIQIGGVEKGMDAERKGLRRGDILQTANGHLIRSTHRLREIIKASQGKPVEIVFTRGRQTNTISVSPSQREMEGQKSWMIGVRLEPRVIYTTLSFPDALGESVRQNAKSAGLIYQFLRGIIQQRMSPKSLEGPIRIAQLSGDAAREGPSAFLGLMAMVSLNLAIFNLLPIPILDGGVIVLLLFEMLIRKDLSLNVKEAVMKFGFVFLMMVVVFVLYNDISKIILRG